MSPSFSSVRSKKKLEQKWLLEPTWLRDPFLSREPSLPPLPQPPGTETSSLQETLSPGPLPQGRSRGPLWRRPPGGREATKGRRVKWEQTQRRGGLRRDFAKKRLCSAKLKPSPSRRTGGGRPEAAYGGVRDQRQQPGETRCNDTSNNGNEWGATDCG